MKELTARESGVAHCIYCGMSNAQIAKHYSTSLQTIKNKITSVMGKIGTRDRTILAIWWARYAIYGNERPVYSPDKRAGIYNHHALALKSAGGSGVTKKQRSEILQINGGICECCGAKSNLTIDHVVPLSVGGENSPDNCQVLCRSCNSKKGKKSTDYRKLVPMGYS